MVNKSFNYYSKQEKSQIDFKVENNLNWKLESDKEVYIITSHI